MTICNLIIRRRFFKIVYSKPAIKIWNCKNMVIRFDTIVFDYDTKSNKA